MLSTTVCTSVAKSVRLLLVKVILLSRIVAAEFTTELTCSLVNPFTPHTIVLNTLILPLVSLIYSLVLVSMIGASKIR